MSAYMYGIIFCIILGVASAVVEVIVKEGDSLFLPCRGAPGNMCIWTALYPDGISEVIAMSNDQNPTSRYHLTDSPQSGDCSLNITDIKSSDVEMLVCTIKPNPPVIKYNVTVGVQPQDPLVVYNNQNVNDGDIVVIQTPAEIKCIVRGGKPAPEVTWKTQNNYFINGTTVDNGDTIDVTQTLKIDNFLQEPKPEITITCTAVHPLYPYIDHQKSITITVGEEYITHVEIKSDWEEVAIGDAILCKADGKPLKYRWYFKKHGDSQLSFMGNDQQLTVYSEGLYHCEATYEYSGAWIKSSKRISVGNKCCCISSTKN